jgi:NAD(P)-dependent dehydrogenase (short-subunit alcohol dehydrogenase family)
MSGKFDNRTALITGAGRGIGRELACHLAAGGACVGLIARSEDELAQTAARVEAIGGTATIFPADLSDLSTVVVVADHARDKLGRIDILINGAATPAPLGASVSVNIGEWASTLALNVTAAAALTFAVLPDQLENHWGRVVNISASIASHPGMMPGMNAYATSKAALEGHSVNLAAELGGTGVTVNVYRPGIVDTAMPGWIRDQSPDEIGSALHGRFAKLHAEGKMITAEHTAQVLARRLGSSDATGQIWHVDDDVDPTQ